MKELFTFFFFILTLSAQAQFGWGGDKAIKQIKNTETLVLMEQSNAYNEAIREAFEEHWTFTKFRFISAPHYKKYCNDKKYSFVMPVIIKDWAFENESYMDIGLMMGGRCKVSTKDMVAFSNLMTWGDEDRYKSECARAVQMMQNYLEMGMNESLPKENLVETAAIYSNKSKSEIPETTLLIDRQNILAEYQDIETIQSFYPYPVKLVSAEEIEQATLDQDPNISYHVLIFDTRGYKYHTIIRAKDSKVLFCNEARKKETILIGKKNLSLAAGQDK